MKVDIGVSGTDTKYFCVLIVLFEALKGVEGSNLST